MQTYARNLDVGVLVIIVQPQMTPAQTLCPLHKMSMS